jgi:hypothetical protein
LVTTFFQHEKLDALLDRVDDPVLRNARLLVEPPLLIVIAMTALARSESGGAM